jgi:hypothetical protein
METDRPGGQLQQIRRRLRAAFAEDHPPQVIARYFAGGIFLATLPSLGLVVPLSSYSERIPAFTPGVNRVSSGEAPIWFLLAGYSTLSRSH